jgi:hypothetical protein
LIAARLGLIRYPPWVIRRVLGEEMGHAIVGPNDDRAKEWAWCRYGGLVEPPLWAPVLSSDEAPLTSVRRVLTYS